MQELVGLRPALFTFILVNITGDDYALLQRYKVRVEFQSNL